MENEQIKTYLIPNNFIDESRTFNGMLKTRNVIEAAISLAVVGLPSWTLIPATVSSKLSIVLGLSLPVPLLCITGVNGDSFFTFVKYAMNWRKNKQIMLFNYEARTFQTRPIEIAMTETSAADRLRNMYDSYREAKAKQSAEVELVENVDFVFMEDTEFEKMTIVDDSAKVKEKEDRRQKKARLAREKATAKYEAKRKKELAKEARRNKKKKPAAEIPTIDIPVPDANVTQETLTFEDVSVAELAHNAVSIAKEPTDPKDNPPVTHNPAEAENAAVDEHKEAPSSEISPSELKENTITGTDNSEQSIAPVDNKEPEESKSSGQLTSASASSNSPDNDSIAVETATSSETEEEEVKPVPRKRKRNRNRKRNNNGGGDMQ